MQPVKTEKVEIELPVQEGYEFLGYRPVQEGEYVLDRANGLCGPRPKGEEYFQYLCYRKKVEYEFWLPDCGMKNPEDIPEGCELWAQELFSWESTDLVPLMWSVNVYRWPKQNKEEE